MPCSWWRVAFIKPEWVPPLPLEARIYKEKNGSSGHTSLFVLSAVSWLAGLAWWQVHDSILGPWLRREDPAPMDEKFVLTLIVVAFVSLLLSLANNVLRLGLLSKLAVRCTYALVPPLVLIFLVLGTIFLGLATPTEGGAMGALGALLMAIGKRKLSWTLLNQALENTTRLSIFVMFILIGSTVFSFTFNAADGHVFVEHLFAKLPGGAMGFLIFVNVLIFFLGMFIDFFEIAFIVLPLLAPVAEKMGIDLIWFGVIVAMNIQTSFLTPPFGFALFYLRSVAARTDYDDRVTGEKIPAVSTMQIYKGAIAFIVIQVIMVATVIINPELVLGNMEKGPGDLEALEQLEAGSYQDGSAAGDSQGYGEVPMPAPRGRAEESPTEAMERMLRENR